MKNVIHVLGVSGSGTTMARLCLSAFARVATQPLRKVNQPAVPLPQRIRAGCDPPLSVLHCLLASLPQRIRAGCDRRCRCCIVNRFLCHSAFARVATWHTEQRRCYSFFATAHSRGLRLYGRHLLAVLNIIFATAHSRGLRLGALPDIITAIVLCHSAFARVATVISRV